MGKYLAKCDTPSLSCALSGAAFTELLLTLCSTVLLLLLLILSCSCIPVKEKPVKCGNNTKLVTMWTPWWTTFKYTVTHVQYVIIIIMFMDVPIGDFPIDPCAACGEQGNMRGEQGTESTSLMLSSTEDVSDKRDNSGGARLPDMVRTRGEPQCSSQPLSTVWADFWNQTRSIFIQETATEQAEHTEDTDKASIFC